MPDKVEPASLIGGYSFRVRAATAKRKKLLAEKQHERLVDRACAVQDLHNRNHSRLMRSYQVELCRRAADMGAVPRVAVVGKIDVAALVAPRDAAGQQRIAAEPSTPLTITP